jgi:signal transduction histidine kinase
MKPVDISIEDLTFIPSKRSTVKVELKPLNIFLQPEEIHTILGEKESGKSLISNILKGTIKATSGRIRIGSKSFKNLSIKESRRKRIEVVTDKRILFENINVGEQFFLYHQTMEYKKIFDARTFNIEVNRFLELHKADFNAETEISSLNESDRIFLEILISIFCEPILLVLDDVLSKLTTNNWNKTIETIKQLSAAGGIVLLLINHIDYIPIVTTKLSVLRNGEIVLSDLYGNLDKYNLIKILYSHVLKNDYTISSNKDFYKMIKYNQAILIDLPVVLIAVDNNFHIKFLNLHAERYFQTKTSKMLNHPLRALLTIPEQASSEIRNENESTITVKTQIFFNGIKRIANITSFFIQESDESIGRILILTDTTEEESLREHIVQNEKLASVGMLAAGVAHEINHPLGIIKNIIEIMKFNYSETPLTDDVEIIEDEIKIISQIISNLMGFSGEENASLEVFEVGDLILRVVRLLTFYAKKNSVTINLSKKKDLFEIYANKTEIRQVFLNLIRNAIEAMPEGGELNISLKEGVGNEKVEIIFQDNGVGIDVEQINDIFLPFYSSKKSQSPGMGMGLYISYNTITKFKGEIAAENVPEGGTKFTIVFPLVK